MTEIKTTNRTMLRDCISAEMDEWYITFNYASFCWFEHCPEWHVLEMDDDDQDHP